MNSRLKLVRITKKKWPRLLPKKPKKNLAERKWLSLLRLSQRHTERTIPSKLLRKRLTGCSKSRFAIMFWKKDSALTEGRLTKYARFPSTWVSCREHTGAQYFSAAK